MALGRRPAKTAWWPLAHLACGPAYPSPRASTASSSRAPAAVSAARIASSSTPSAAPRPSIPAASPARAVTSAAAISWRPARSPPFPLHRRGRRQRGYRPGRADRLTNSRHFLHQILEPPVLGDLPLHLLQLRPRLQVHIHRLTAHPPGQVVLRPMPAMPRPGTRTVLLAALAPDHIQRTPPEIPNLGDQAEQLGAAALQPRQVPASRRLRHARLPN